MTPEERLAEIIAHLKVQGLLSEERERIYNPVKDSDKYHKYGEAIISCNEITHQFKGKLSSTNPDFPTDCHLIIMEFPIEESDEIILRETIKGKLIKVINDCDELSFITTKQGDLSIYIGFEDIYTPRETK